MKPWAVKKKSPPQKKKAPQIIIIIIIFGGGPSKVFESNDVQNGVQGHLKSLPGQKRPIRMKKSCCNNA